MIEQTPIIIAEDVHKWYGKFHVLQGVSLKVNRGEVVVLMGASGSGKSTFIRTFNALEEYQQGKIEIDGIILSNDLRNIETIRREVGMVFQQFNLFPHLTVLDNLALAPQQVLKRSRRESEERAYYYLEQVGLADKAHNYPEQLSGGQKQRVAIARSLCMEPQIMLFDEPTSALDPELVGEVLEVMQRLAANGMTMMIVTHEIQFARDVASRVMFLDQGVVIEEGNARQVLTNPQSDRLTAFLSRMRQAYVLPG